MDVHSLESKKGVRKLRRGGLEKKISVRYLNKLTIQQLILAQIIQK